MGVVTSKRVGQCKNCPFWGAAVGTRGPVDSPFMIVGESPGREELKDGIPFVGKSWEVLKHAIERSGISIPKGCEPYVTNAFHCWPGNSIKDETTINQAAASCRSCLVEEINAYPRKLLLTLGAAALRSVTNNYGLKITRERGRYISQDLYADIKGVEHAIATIHPAFILRGGGNYRQFRGDIRYAMHLLAGGSTKRHPSVDYTLIEHELDLYRTLADLERVAHANPYRVFGADIETGSPEDDPYGPGGFDYFRDSILSIAICYEPEHVYIIPEHLILHPYTRRIFQIPNIRWLWHNGKFDIKFLWAYDIEEARVDEDSMLASYCLDERTGGGKVHGLEVVSGDWLSAPNWKGMLDKLKKKGESYRAIMLRDPHKFYSYQAYDTSNTLRLFQVMNPDISQDAANKRFYYRTLIPATMFLAKVEERGMLVDFAKVKENEVRLTREAQVYAEEVFKEALKYPNKGFTEKLLNSWKQLGILLYDCMKLPPYKNERSTDDGHLEELPQVHVVKNLRNYRKVFKQLSTYVRPLYSGRMSDGKMHISFKQHVTSTSRLASGDPMNLQNIPRDADIRGQFIPPPGYVYVEPDLNQAELRCLAAFSKDKELCRIYTDPNSEGIHDIVRRERWGDPKDWSRYDFERYVLQFKVIEKDEALIIKSILDEQKMKAKNINFGIVYGITEFGLADQMECSHAEAREALAVWRRKFPEAWRFIRECMNAPSQGLNIVTPFGNKKRHHVVTQENIHNLEKEAANFPHQATASNIMLHGCIEQYQRFRQVYDAHFVNMMHDGTLIEVPFNYEAIVGVCQDMIQTLERVPLDWGLDAIPFVAEAKIGFRWGRAHMTDWKKLKLPQHPNWITTSGRGKIDGTSNKDQVEIHVKQGCRSSNRELGELLSLTHQSVLDPIQSLQRSA